MDWMGAGYMAATIAGLVIPEVKEAKTKAKYTKLRKRQQGIEDKVFAQNDFNNNVNVNNHAKRIDSELNKIEKERSDVI